MHKFVMPPTGMGMGEFLTDLCDFSGGDLFWIKAAAD